VTRHQIAQLRIKLRLEQPIEPREVEALIEALERSQFAVQIFNNATGGELADMVNQELAKNRGGL